MKILLTGASSFTGYWFARALHDAGHHVVAPLRRAAARYDEGTRAERVRRLAAVAEIVDDCSFGSERFLACASAGGFDLLCHHAAQVGDYRSAAFDIVGAVTANVRNIREVLATVPAVVLTGSVFEQGEGAGDAPLRAFSPYGLSKGLTADIVQHTAREAGVGCGKFVIPNPFGPLEEPRFCAYLMRTWQKGDVAEVRTPAYVRDNIHVGLLAGAYARYAAEVAAGTAAAKLNPSGYVESQGAFASRFAAEIRQRTGLSCALALAQQVEFSEPATRINTQPAQAYVPSWRESEAWDAVAEAYR